MKFNEKYFSYPPYLSTTWDQVSSLSLQSHPTDSHLSLTFYLKNGEKIYLPELEEQEVESIFSSYQKAMELKGESNRLRKRKLLQPYSSLLENQDPLFALSNTQSIPPSKQFVAYDSLGRMLTHSENEKDLAPLPKEILSRIAAVSKLMFKTQDLDHLPKPVKGCNCLHCQVARAISKGVEYNEDLIDEEITEEDLRFGSWQIQEIDTDRFLVSNPDDLSEYYTVSLKPTLTCTCGEDHCEHMRAVLMT